MIGGEAISTVQPSVTVRDREKQRAASKRHYEKNKPAMIARAMAFNLKRRDELKALVADYLSKHPCIDCGEDDPIVLEFDHRDPSEKTANIGDMVSRVKGHSVQRVMDEIAKCDVRCANCHRRATFHARRAGAFDRHQDAGNSNLPCATSSGDGLGIHEPGSNTRGGRIATPAPSGRAAEAAMCPVVTRLHSIARGATPRVATGSGSNPARTRDVPAREESGSQPNGSVQHPPVTRAGRPRSETRAQAAVGGARKDRRSPGFRILPAVRCRCCGRRALAADRQRAPRSARGASAAAPGQRGPAGWLRLPAPAASPSKDLACPNHTCARLASA